MQKLATPEIRQFIISGVTVIRASANYTKNEKIYLLRQLLSISWRLSSPVNIQHYFPVHVLNHYILSD